MAEKKVSELPEELTPTTDDYLLMTDTGTVVSKKTTIANVIALKTFNLVDDTSPQLGGSLDSQNFDVQNMRTASFNGITDNGNSGASATIDFTAGHNHKITLTDNCTLTFTAPDQDTTRKLIVEQDGTGGHTLTFPGNVKLPGGSITLSSAGGSIDILTLYFDGSSYYGELSKDFQ